MLIEARQEDVERRHNIIIVGAGPVGIVAAMELARLGQDVTLLESGTLDSDPEAQKLSDAIRVDERRNADMTLVVQRRFGGTSNLWGAGCVPLDPQDFEKRPVAGNVAWPISYTEFASYLPAACRYANCGQIFEHGTEAPVVADNSFTDRRLMRFADPASFLQAYRRSVTTSSKITALLGATVTFLRFADDGSVATLEVRLRDGSHAQARGRVVILACGDVETARLLLATQMEAPLRFGGEAGMLGRNYMGHLSGALAQVRFATEAVDQSFDFFLGPDGAYARRRLTAEARTQALERLTNIAFWPTLPVMRDPAHRDPVLSLAYLALSVPPLGRRLVSESLRRINVGEGGRWPEHVRNVALGLPSLAATLPRFLHGRFLARRRLPGLHLRNRARRYMLHYHAEHLPCPQSRVRLSTVRDSMGMPRAILDLRFTEADAVPIVRTHELLARWLARTRIGFIEWLHPGDELCAQVLAQAGDGVHQIGTVRMAEDARTGVVDVDCRTFDSKNLFVAGSAVFPSSGQANPTLSAIALAVRLARQVAAEASSHGNSGPT